MIETKRLIIRPFKMSDYKKVYEACNDFEVAKMTLGIPVPYTEEDAKSFIEYTLNTNPEKSLEWAICLKDSDEVVGCMALMNIKRPSNKAELAYWVGRKYWNQGIATEAAKGMIQYGFETLKLNSVHAKFFDINPASGKVMKKCGMTYVGKMRAHEFRFDTYFDVECYEILKSDFDAISR